MLTKQTPVSAFGGIVALNREVDAATAGGNEQNFLRSHYGTCFPKEALDILEAKKNIRLIELSKPESGQVTVKKCLVVYWCKQKMISKKTELTIKELLQGSNQQRNNGKPFEFAWKLVKHVKSNAILISNENVHLVLGPDK